jgi:hypothetical protein
MRVFVNIFLLEGGRWCKSQTLKTMNVKRFITIRISNKKLKFTKLSVYFGDKLIAVKFLKLTLLWNLKVVHVNKISYIQLDIRKQTNCQDNSTLAYENE